MFGWKDPFVAMYAFVLYILAIFCFSLFPSQKQKSRLAVIHHLLGPATLLSQIEKVDCWTFKLCVNQFLLFSVSIPFLTFAANVLLVKCLLG